MLVVAIVSKGFVPVGNVSGDIKPVIESRALLSGVGDTNDDANGADIDKVAAARGLKRGVDVWPILVVVIADGESSEVAAFIIVLTIDTSPIFVGVVGMA